MFGGLMQWVYGPVKAAYLRRLRTERVAPELAAPFGALARLTLVGLFFFLALASFLGVERRAEARRVFFSGRHCQSPRHWQPLLQQPLSLPPQARPAPWLRAWRLVPPARAPKASCRSCQDAAGCCPEHASSHRDRGKAAPWICCGDCAFYKYRLHTIRAGKIVIRAGGKIIIVGSEDILG